MSTTEIKKTQTIKIEIDMDVWANFRKLVHVVGEHVDNTREPPWIADGVSPLSRITRTIVEQLHRSDESSPSPYRDCAWEILRELVAEARIQNPRSSKVLWSCKETVKDVTNYLGETITFSYRVCSVCGHKINDDAKSMAQHEDGHKTGVVKDLDLLPSSFL
jgi:hypothetical protein